MASVFLSARWLGLAMINYEVDPRALRPLVPRGVELDFFMGRTFVSLVGFVFRDTRVLGWSIPWHRHFSEVNLRFYVRRPVAGEDRRGVAFIREIVARRAVSTVARIAYNEPYATAAMRHEWRGVDSPPEACRGEGSCATYGWRHRGEWLEVGVCAPGRSTPLVPGSETEFIAEHYFGYGRGRDGGTIEYRVEHPPWRVWDHGTPIVSAGVADYYGGELAQALRRPPTSAFLADGSAVKVYRPTRLA